MIRHVRNLSRSLLERVCFCVAQRRLPFRRLRGVSLVNRKWQDHLEKHILTTHKIKVGFGPIFSGEDDLHVRKWRIDPIVDRINENSEKYCAGIFLDVKDMPKFDILVIVREIDDIDSVTINALKRSKKILIYDIVDRPYVKEEAGGYADIFEFVKSMDGIIASSPLHIAEMQGLGKKMALIEHPVLNTRYKDYTGPENKEIRIIWQGYREHHGRMEFIHPIIQRLSRELKRKIKIIYHTNMLPKTTAFIEYRIWTVHNWEKQLISSDIAVENKSLDEPSLQRRPSTKVLSYMAAAVPVVCTPSTADRSVIDHGRTGYLAYTPDDWYMYLKMLINDRGLRKQVGMAAREHALGNFTINKITDKYTSFFDEVAAARR